MDPAIKNAIDDRRASGKTDEEIIQEFVTSGYPEDVARAHVTEAVVQTGVAIPAPNTATPEPSTDDSLSTPTSHKSIFLPILIGLTLVFVLATGALVALGQINPVAMINGLFGKAPYTSETDLLVGISKDLADTTYADLMLEVGAELLPEDPSLNVQQSEEIDELFSALSMFGVSLPSEGHAKLTLDAEYDFRESKENFDFTGQFRLDVLMEPFIFKGALSVMKVEEKGYFRIDDLPTLFESSLKESGMPLEQWVEIEDVEQIMETQSDPRGFMPLMQVPAPLPLVQNYTDSLQQWGSTVVESANSLKTNPPNRMVANIIQAEPKLPSLSEADQEALARAVIENPPFVFVGEPKMVEGDGDVYFVYEVDLDHGGLASFVELAVESSDDLRDSFDAEEFYEEFTPEFVDKVNQMTELYFHVYADGSFKEYRTESYIQPSDADSVVHLFFRFGFVSLDNAPKIVAPTEVFEKTMEELIAEEEAKQEQARMEARDSSIKFAANRLRTIAEIHYAENGFSYAGFCNTDEVASQVNYINRNLQGALVPTLGGTNQPKIRCNQGQSAYAFATPLPSDPENKLYCIDSTGYADEVDSFAETASSCTE